MGDIVSYIVIKDFLSNLKWGTKGENGKDKIKHRTSKVNKGISHGMSKLNEFDVKQVIKTYETGEFTQQEIAATYGVHQSVIPRIVNKKVCKHIYKGY